MKYKLVIIIVLVAIINGYSQRLKQKVGDNPTLIAPSAVMEVESTNKGVLFPRVALSGATDVTTIASPETSLLVYNTATSGTAPNNVFPGFYYWDGTIWSRFYNSPSVASITCSSATHNGYLSIGNAADGVSSVIPYTGGNGGSYEAQSIASTGVTGLTATLAAGTLAGGAGTLTYYITGTPSTTGTANFAINIGGKSCTLTRTVVPLSVITSINCNGATHNGFLSAGNVATNVSSSIPYSGGNGGFYTQQSIVSTSSGVEGLTATLSIGILNNGTGSITYTITGTPSANGFASFAISLGGQSCTFTRQVGCGAYTAAGVYKIFACHNLGADTTLNPHIPAQGLIGNYYQWGKISPVAIPTTSATDAIPGWSTSSAGDGSWLSNKTGNDPCPAGFRVPTQAELAGIFSNNTVTRTGLWNNNNTSAIHLGPTDTNSKWLTLPTTGYRSGTDGKLNNMYSEGYYWSANHYNNNTAFYTGFNNNITNNIWTADIKLRTFGFAVRCISE